MNDAPRTWDLLRGALPAVLVGVLSAVLLWLVDTIAEVLEYGVWNTLPGLLGIARESPWWIVGVLTLTGLIVGLIVQFAPGRGGSDTATIEFLAPLAPLSALPSVAAVLIVGLAGGVSLGPEGPIIAIATSLAVTILGRIAPGLPTPVVIMITAAGTVGAMFGTPVAAALLLTGMLAAAGVGGSLWDRLFLPLVAAAVGSLTTIFLGGPGITLELPPYSPQLLDLLTGSLVAAAAAAAGIIAVLVFPHTHALFRRLRHPVIYITLGGAVLGVLGWIGGPVTLFKGLRQMVELLAERDSLAPVAVVTIVLVKLAALVIAATAGFRGGRIFPAIFIGVAVGVLANSLFPTVPVGLAIAAGVLGMVLVVAKDGWLALFVAAGVSGDIATLPVLCVIVLPTWLIARSVPDMIVHSPPTPEAPPEPGSRPGSQSAIR